MKQTISILLLCALFVCMIPIAGCGEADRSGEWGAYYEAFLSFADEMKKDTRYICIDISCVEEQNRTGLYDLVYAYCKDNGMSIVQGDWGVLHSMQLLDDSSEFTDGYLLSFADAKWSEDRSQVTFVVSLKRVADVHADNLGGSVSLAKKGNAWQVTSEKTSDLKQSKAGAYLAVLEYYISEAGMSGLKTILAMDPDGVEADVWQEVKQLVTSCVGKQGYRFMEADWQGLVEHGYVDAGVFVDGYLLSYEDHTWSSDNKTFAVTSWMKEGDMRALGGNFTVEWINGSWQVTDVQTMMS